MPLIQVGIDVTGLLPRGIPVNERMFPNLAHAVAELAAAGHRQWVGYAAGATLPDGATLNARSGTYLRSIHDEPDGALAHRVYSDAPHAKAIEEGTSAYDMKQMLRTSIKTRRTKAGRLYLIIPFRWGTPGTVGFGKGSTMGDAGYAAAKPLVSSRVTGMTTRTSASGHQVPQRVYRWGGRLGAKALADAGVHGREAKRMQGMVRFQGDRGGNSDSHYLTFRVMSEGSTGWVRKAQPGKWPARTVAEQLQRVAPEILSAAVAADVQAALWESHA